MKLSINKYFDMGKPEIIDTLIFFVDPGHRNWAYQEGNNLQICNLAFDDLFFVSRMEEMKGFEIIILDKLTRDALLDVESWGKYQHNFHDVLKAWIDDTTLTFTDGSGVHHTFDLSGIESVRFNQEW